MKIFRVHLTDESGMSLGFEYDSIEERYIAIGKYEFLKLLNDWASHPDNG